MAERASRFARVHVDFGTGDGKHVLRSARARPDTLFLGVDAAAESLRAAAHSAARKPVRGGLANALFGRLAAETAPGELCGLADSLSVLLPWGSLLRAVAAPDPARLRNLAAIAKPGAELRIVFGYGAGDADARALGLPALDPARLSPLCGAYAEAGLAAYARLLAREELSALGTTWSGKLAFSDKPRAFVELRARCAIDSDHGAGQR